MNVPALPPPLPVEVRRSGKGILIAVGVVVLTAAFVAIGGAVWWIRTSANDEPEMLRTFTEHRGEFESLQQMVLQDDGLFSISAEALRVVDEKKVPLSSGRVAQYRSLLRSVGASEGLRNDGDAIWLTHSVQGLSVSYSEIGWVFTTRPLDGAHVISSFREIPANAGDSVYFVPIVAGWYLYRESS